MNVAALGNTIYAAIKDDSAAITSIRSEFTSLSLALLTDPNSTSRVTSATINGQMFTASPTMTNGQRLSLIRWVVACIEQQSPISKVQGTSF